MISLVVAMADNGVIGRDGALPWRIPDDMRRFRALTLGKPCIMGRRTWESLPTRPLPGRSNIVITRNAGYRAEGATVVHSLDDALRAVGAAEEICIIGGADIYRAALPRADRIHLTQVHADIAGDTFLDPFDSRLWRESERRNGETPEGLRYSYVTLERRQV